MPNNFKLSGDYYVSKAGNDSWDGLTPDTPKRTIQAALNLITSGTRYIIIGTGFYRESIVIGPTSVSNIILIGDGDVILDGANSNFYSVNIIKSVNQGYLEFKNLKISNYLSFSVSVESNNLTVGFRFENCFLENCDTVSLRVPAWGASLIVTNTKIINCKNFSTSLSATVSFSGNLAVNSNISIAGTLAPFCSITNCYFDRYSTIISTSNLTTFNYNNIQDSNIILSFASTVTTGTYQDAYGRYYNLSIVGNNTTFEAGTIGNPYYRADTLGKAFSYATHKILYPTYNVNSISEDPKFNDLLARDFTLQSGSPHIGRASDGINNIGGTRSAIRAAANSSSFSGSGATVDSGLTFSYDNYVISGSAVTGSVTSAPIFVSSSAKVIQEIDYNGLLAFNKTTSSFFSSGSNVNVPDFDTYTSASGNPGANPDRLVYYMRLTTGSTQPVVDADWDNGNLWTRGDYNVFEWNTKPSIDIYGRGNGDPNFVVANSSFLRATYIQMKVKLRNDYLQ
jgi:cytoskeletal protein CcmA (bactofilin family)